MDTNTNDTRKKQQYDRAWDELRAAGAEMSENQNITSARAANARLRLRFELLRSVEAEAVFVYLTGERDLLEDIPE